jgi:hypothetical protein
MRQHSHKLTHAHKTRVARCPCTGRFKAAKKQLAQARIDFFAAAGVGDTPALKLAVRAHARLCFLSYISHETRHCQLVG